MYDFSFLASGIALGLTAGLSPGPLQTLIISQTLRHSTREGIMVAIAPLITDLPILGIAVLILSQLSDVNPIMGLISLSGALFLGYLAYENIRIKGIETDNSEVNPRSVKKGVITNFLNPHPYMFWLLVGAPLILKAYRIDIAYALSFLVAFFTCLVGTFIVIAGLVGRSRSFLRGRVYIYMVRCLGILLLVFSLIFVRDGLKFFGIINGGGNG